MLKCNTCNAARSSLIPIAKAASKFHVFCEIKLMMATPIFQFPKMHSADCYKKPKSLQNMHYRTWLRCNTGTLAMSMIPQLRTYYELSVLLFFGNLREQEL